jgi:hypothetical protein
MLELATVDLGDPTSRVVDLTRADDPRWSGLLVLAPHESVELAADAWHDLLVLSGAVDDGTGCVLDGGDFARRCGAARLSAGPTGASVLAYRQAQIGAACAEITVRRDSRPWRQGRTPGMTVASLSNDDHAVSFVMWQPGSPSRHHAHAGGEEIFVVRGELCAGDVRHPAGSWMRLYPGVWHSPLVETPTLILVRNGHLRPRA